MVHDCQPVPTCISSSALSEPLAEASGVDVLYDVIIIPFHQIK